MVMCTDHIGIHEGADGRYGRTDVRTLMTLPYFLNYGAPRAELRYKEEMTFMPKMFPFFPTSIFPIPLVFDLICVNC